MSTFNMSASVSLTRGDYAQPLTLPPIANAMSGNRLAVLDLVATTGSFTNLGNTGLAAIGRVIIWNLSAASKLKFSEDSGTTVHQTIPPGEWIMVYVPAGTSGESLTLQGDTATCEFRAFLFDV